MRVLIAEDEVEIARALKVVLEHQKYTVDIVHNGLDALDYVLQTSYDVIVLDIMSGDYSATITAASSQTSTSADFRITVKTETVWGIVGIALIVVMIGGIYLVFRKYGRR